MVLRHRWPCPVHIGGKGTEAREDDMLTPHNSEVIDQDRRRILGTAAMGVAIAGTISLFHADMA